MRDIDALVYDPDVVNRNFRLRNIDWTQKSPQEKQAVMSEVLGHYVSTEESQAIFDAAYEARPDLFRGLSTS